MSSGRFFDLGFPFDGHGPLETCRGRALRSVPLQGPIHLVPDRGRHTKAIPDQDPGQDRQAVHRLIDPFDVGYDVFGS
jgi:hypothetical protein